LAGETEVLGENLPQRHFCPSQNPTCLGPVSNPGPQRWESEVCSHPGIQSTSIPEGKRSFLPTVEATITSKLEASGRLYFGTPIKFYPTTRNHISENSNLLHIRYFQTCNHSITWIVFKNHMAQHFGNQKYSLCQHSVCD
jgi:hypothetical protein